MALIAIQCKNCNGKLQVDSEAKSYYCPFCNTSYAMEQTINQTFQTTNIGHIETANIIDDGSGKIDQEIYSAEALLQLRKYWQAREKFQYLTNNYAHKHRAWWGLARAITEDFTREPSGGSEFLVINDAMESAIQLAPAQERPDMQAAQSLYCSRWTDYYNQLTAERTGRLQIIDKWEQEETDPRLRKAREIQATIDSKQSKLEKVERAGTLVPLIAFFVIGAILVLATLKENGPIGAVLGSALLAGVGVFLPLKIVFFFICKGVRVPTEMLIKHSRTQIDQIIGEIENLQAQANGNRQQVYQDTAWLDR